MNPVILESLVLLGLCFIAAVTSRNKVEWKWIFIAVATYATHKWLLFTSMHPSLIDILPGRYNWEGKLIGTAYVILLGVIIFKGRIAEFGLTLKQNGPAVTAGYSVAAVTFVAIAVFQYLYFPGTKSEPTADWLYQLTMPSLDEELLYRGVLLLMLERAFKPSFKLAGAPLGYAALISVVMFYAAHILGVSADWTITVNWGDILSLFYAVLWIYVRVATGSLLLPILLHSWANTAGYLI